MLMPSALSSCDSSQQRHQPSGPHTRLQSALFASPPASPPTLSNQQGTIDNIFNTCRSLQALLSPPAAQSAPAETTAETSTPAPTTQLPTPPLSHAPPPLKLRLRPRAPRPDGGADHLPRKKVVKRAPPRGANKRRRCAGDDMGREDASDDDNEDIESDLEISPSKQKQKQQQKPDSEPETPPAPRTPKRARIAPEVLPLGLERADYHKLHANEAGSSSRVGLGLRSLNNAPPITTEPLAQRQQQAQPQQQGTGVEVEGDGEWWSTEDDRILVELVLDKLKLTKTEWQDCARSLGKDRNSLSRRWRSLMTKGDVGLKGSRASRRGKIHATWR